MDVVMIPTAEILKDALLRDRVTLDPDAQTELRLSICQDGLRQPIEVWRLSQPRDGHLYGLIAGLRRLTAFQELHGMNNLPCYAAIPAFVRPVADLPAAMRLMVTENEIRAPITPWEKGSLLVGLVAEDLFPTLDAAIEGLYPALSRQRRNRLRSLALVFQEMEGDLTTPDLLTQAQMEQLAAGLRAGLGPVIFSTLADHRRASLPTQWAALVPVLSETFEAAAEPSGATRPRRLMDLKQGLSIRREKCKGGWILRFTGPEARSGGLIDDVFDLIERMLQPGQ
jgi:ParB family transcriptional regulator, chromosome partitioning protein